MSVNIVTGTHAKSKGNFSPAVQKREQERELRLALISSIMHSSDADAFETMKIAGWRSSKNPETRVTVDAIARFYGVETSYLRHLFMRCGVTAKRSPGFVTRNYGGNTYSIRVALAACCRMMCGRTVPANSVANRVEKVLKVTDYYKDAMDYLHGKDSKAAEASCSVTAVDGQITMSTDFFANLFKQLGQEIASAMTKTAITQEQKTEDKTSEIVELYSTGTISGCKAAKLLNVSPSYFYRRYGKEKQIATNF